MRNLYFVLFFFVSICLNVNAQTSTSGAGLVKDGKNNNVYLVDYNTIELKEEMLIKVLDLSIKNQDKLVNYFSTVKGMSMVGFCEQRKTFKVKVDPSVYTNLTDLEHKIIDTKIVTQIEFKKGNFSDLDQACQ